MQDPEKVAALYKAKSILAEHFEIGMLMVQSEEEADCTARYEIGWGNTFARKEHIRMIYGEEILGIECPDAEDIEE